MERMQFVLCGSCTMEQDRNPYAVTQGASRQRLLRLINQERCGSSKIADLLRVSENAVQDDLRALEKAGLVKSSAEGYVPAFAIFTLDDQRHLQPLIERVSRSYAHAVEQAMGLVQAAYDDCGLAERGFSFSDMAYILVGAYILDYGGLDFLARSGLLTPTRSMPGGRYVFVGYEGQLFNLRGNWMFGHNYQFGPFVFSGHGELPSEGGRKAFPDHAYRWWAEGRPEEEVEQLMKEAGHILTALCQGARTLQALRQRTGQSPDRIQEHLQRLEELAYVESKDGTWRSWCPVVVPEDKACIRKMVEEVWERLLEQVVNHHWKELAERYAKTAPARNGVDIREAFNPLHHAFFEDALRQLMEEAKLPYPPLRPDGARYAIWVEQQGTEQASAGA